MKNPNIEAGLIKDNIHLIAQYEKETSDQNEVCSNSCRLLKQKNV